MRHSIFWRTLWEQRLRLLLWQLGFGAVALLYGSVYPLIRNPEMQAALEAYPSDLLDAFGIIDMISPAGYLQSSVFGIIGPVVLIIYAVGLGARAVAGDEERGLLELLLAGPHGRTSFYLQRGSALLVMVALSGLSVCAATLAINGPAELQLPAGNIAAMAVHFSLLGAVLAAVSFSIGAAGGRAGISLAVGSIVGIGGYLANNLAPRIDGLAWLQDVSPFYYYLSSSPLKNGIDAPHALILAGAALLPLLLAWPLFLRRDLGIS
jgi:ABC-2 type transport system permease protein